MRYIVAIRRPADPVCYYLSKSGLRCYTDKNVYVAKSRAEADEQRDYFADRMREFVLTVERLPARVSLSEGLLRAVPVEEVEPCNPGT